MTVQKDKEEENNVGVKNPEVKIVDPEAVTEVSEKAKPATEVSEVVNNTQKDGDDTEN